ncbi:MAG: fumarylacetoacetate hydrolase family protein [Bdellovibrionaceae bacterium]|nr:fumarylacetoacetate hydrolase family protein [Bdellovibrionales bacterium]MCB9086235.1 fumarylacetoacetate hydrolase family protein [Pseudobdellovibrionaceae bacterium]
MKLASLKSAKSRDGELIVVSRDNKMAVKADSVAPSLREAIEKWSEAKPKLEALYQALNSGDANGAFEIKEEDLHSAMPRAFQWADGSAFIHHVKLVRKARNAPLPETLLTTPLMYQGGGDSFLAPREDIPQVDFGHGTDFEGEVAVVVGDVPMGITPEKALDHIILFVTVNDVSLRGLIPEELAQGFGFFQSKPSSALSPFAVTADELGDAWKEGRIHLPLLVEYNGEFFGNADAGQMHFHFGDLIAHAARTRDLAAGTVIGSGTVSNEDMARGSSCLAEKRMLEKIHEGTIKTPFMKEGDTIRIEMKDKNGNNIFGTIFQKVVKREI